LKVTLPKGVVTPLDRAWTNATGAHINETLRSTKCALEEANQQLRVAMAHP
jgi:hypothetical protein